MTQIAGEDAEKTTLTTDKEPETSTPVLGKHLKKLHTMQMSTVKQVHQMQVSAVEQLHQLQIDTLEQLHQLQTNTDETPMTNTDKHAEIATPIAAKPVEITAPAVANPAPLGLCAFALTTFVLSAHNIGLFKGGAVVIGLALFYGGLAQLLAGMWEFRSNNTFGALAFTSYGAFWLATGWALQNGQITDGFRYVLVAWAIFTLIGFLGTLKTNLALISVFFFLTLTFVVLAIGAFTGITLWTQAGGWLGMVTAALAWYTATAALLSSTKGAFTLPVFPRS